MTKYSDLQQELLLLWNSRITHIKDLTEAGRPFPLSKPMFSALNQSQKRYRAILTNMKKKMGSMRKQMHSLQDEVNRLLQILEGSHRDMAK